MLDLSAVDHTWTLFLDRDGVINEEKHLDYVYNYDEFKFLPGVKEAMKILSDIFSTIIMVTNQRGVGKGLMTEEALLDIQTRMVSELKESGGRIDKWYYCTAINDDHPNRKPNAGMAFQAKSDSTSIDLNKSIIVGNRLSDMQFGRNAGMFTVYLQTTHPQTTSPHPLIDLYFNNLLDFATTCSRGVRKVKQ
jgi:D-glycero-D-manno-heptose 1,7-bisphosphate phosphatase